jgi:hypothetical protein
MRGWLAALVCAAALGLTEGCTDALPEGVDGNLANGWAPPPPAVQWRPLNGKCFDDLPETTSPEDYAPIDCRQRHIAETYWVGDLSGTAARPDANEGKADAARVTAYRECSRRGDGFLGGAWRASRLVVQFVLPDKVGWDAGARWFRCDVAESDDDGALVGREGSLRGALAGDSQLRLGCFDPTIDGDSVRAMASVDCDRAHHAEFVGLWTAPRMPYARLQGSLQLAKGCLSAIARYTKVPDDGMVKYRTGWLGFPGTEAAWTAGDRTVQCFLWLSGETIKGSYKGVGPAKLKIHYA